MLISEKEKKMSAYVIQRGDEFWKEEKDGAVIWTKDVKDACMFTEPHELKSKDEKFRMIVLQFE